MSSLTTTSCARAAVLRSMERAIESSYPSLIALVVMRIDTLAHSGLRGVPVVNSSVIAAKVLEQNPTGPLKTN